MEALTPEVKNLNADYALEIDDENYEMSWAE